MYLIFRGFWGSLNEWSLLPLDFRVSESTSCRGGKRPSIVKMRFCRLCRLAGARRHSPPLNTSFFCVFKASLGSSALKTPRRILCLFLCTGLAVELGLYTA